MIRAIASIFITLGLIFGASCYEMHYVKTTFRDFSQTVQALRKKTLAGNASYQDGEAVRAYWIKKRDVLHVWVPHDSLQEIDYQLSEAIGSLSIGDYAAAVPKLESIADLSESIPLLYTLDIGNVF